jgi:hypothetical protein
MPVRMSAFGTQYGHPDTLSQLSVFDGKGFSSRANFIFNSGLTFWSAVHPRLPRGCGCLQA